MVFLLFAISIIVLEAILQADKKRQKPELAPAQSELLSQDLRALMQALQNYAAPAPPSNQPVARDKGYNRGVAEPTEWVIVRQLPDGDPHSGRLESREGQRLRVSLSPAAKGAEFKVGAPVEVQSERVLYLGVVVLGTAPDPPGSDRSDSAMLIAIEHTVDRVALDAIREVWHGSPGE